MKKMGFTLAEVLITLGIVGVIAALVIPQFVARIHYQSNASKLATVVSDYENIFGMMMMKENTDDIYKTSFGRAFNGNNTGEMKVAFERYTTLARTGTQTSDLGYLSYNMSNPLVPAALASAFSDSSEGETCVEPRCETGTTFYDYGHEPTGAECTPRGTPCPGSARGQCCKCPSGSHLDTGSNRCVKDQTDPPADCPTGMFPSAINTGNCQPMSAEYVHGSDSKKYCCPKEEPQGCKSICQNYGEESHQCKKCECEEKGWIWESETKTCKPEHGCPDGQHWDEEQGGCVPDQVDPCADQCADPASDGCRNCHCGLQNMVWSPELGRCIKGTDPDKPCYKECLDNASPSCKQCDCEHRLPEGTYTWNGTECVPNGGTGPCANECADPTSEACLECLQNNCTPPNEWDAENKICKEPEVPGGGDGEGKTVMKTINNGEVNDFSFTFGATTPSGANIFFGKSPNNSSLATVYIDVNGGSAPNKYGRDVFAFVLNNDGHLLPYGSQAAVKALNLPNTDDNNTWRGGNSQYGCTKRGSYDGLGCTARLVENNYKVDY